MSKVIVVNVTSDDIAQGTPRLIRKCPNALALQRATGCADAWVGFSGLAVDGGKDHTHDTPQAARDFIDAFDAGMPVEPYTFELELVTPSETTPDGLVLNSAQVDAIHRKYAQNPDGFATYEAFRDTAKPMLMGDGGVMIKWAGMWLGIEPNGHTHS